MVGHCVKPACDIQLKFFHSGNLDAHERRSPDIEFFGWCSHYANRVVPNLGSNRSYSVMPRMDPRRSQPARPNRALRMVAVPMPRNLWRCAIPAGLRQLSPLQNDTPQSGLAINSGGICPRPTLYLRARPI